jgi:hypothetical protein
MAPPHGGQLLLGLRIRGGAVSEPILTQGCLTLFSASAPWAVPMGYPPRIPTHSSRG